MAGFFVGEDQTGFAVGGIVIGCLVGLCEGLLVVGKGVTGFLVGEGETSLGVGRYVIGC